MNAEYYSNNSIVVRGDSKPWKDYLKSLGGKWNGRLTGGAGWIFSKDKENELMNFIAQANGGLIQQPQQTAIIPQPTATTPHYPGIPQPTATTPQYPGIPQPKPQYPGIPQPTATTPQYPGIPQPKVLSPTPTNVLPSIPATINYPNLFMAADNLQYQIVIYTSPSPTVGQSVIITIGDNDLEYRVTKIESETPPYDSILIQNVNTDGTPEDQVSRAVLVKGEWKIFGLLDDHVVTFNPVS